jgi:hypothetical protein
MLQFHDDGAQGVAMGCNQNIITLLQAGNDPFLTLPDLKVRGFLVQRVLRSPGSVCW